MKKIIIICMLLLTTFAYSQEQQPVINSSSMNILKGSEAIDTDAYYASQMFALQIENAGKDIIGAFLWGGLSVASGLCGAYISTTEMKTNSNGQQISSNKDVSVILYSVSLVSAIISIFDFVGAGLDLKDAAKYYKRIHPIPNGVSIDF